MRERGRLLKREREIERERRGSEREREKDEESMRIGKERKSLWSGFPSEWDKRKHRSWSSSNSSDGKEIQGATKRDGRGTLRRGSFKTFFGNGGGQN